MDCSPPSDSATFQAHPVPTLILAPRHVPCGSWGKSRTQGCCGSPARPSSTSMSAPLGRWRRATT